MSSPTKNVQEYIDLAKNSASSLPPNQLVWFYVAMALIYVLDCIADCIIDAGG